MSFNNAWSSSTTRIDGFWLGVHPPLSVFLDSELEEAAQRTLPLQLQSSVERESHSGLSIVADSSQVIHYYLQNLKKLHRVSGPVHTYNRWPQSLSQ